MLAAKKTGAERATLIETPLPRLGAEDVLVRVRACAICASDFRGWQASELGPEAPGEWNVNNPGLTGHEVAGDIVDVGHRSLSGRVGERVWIDAITGCGRCEECDAGRQTLCRGVSVICQGFAEYVSAPARQCHPVPEALDYPAASLICDMAGTPIAAAKRAGVQPGDSVAVWGLGPVGLGLVQAACIAGAGRVVGCDPIASRRSFAEAVGATMALDPTQPGAMDRLRAVTGPRGPDIVLCSVASPDAAKQAFKALRLDGRMVTVAGVARAGGHRRKWVSGHWGCDRLHWPEVLDHVASGRFVLGDYVTHTFPLERIEEAFRIRLHDPAGSLKVVVAPS